jgi:hypothetical protein
MIVGCILQILLLAAGDKSYPLLLAEVLQVQGNDLLYDFIDHIITDFG